MIDEPTRMREILDAVMHVTQIFPSDTNLTCIFMAHADANTWSAWTEIVDSGATSLSALFATVQGYITSLGIEILSDVNAVYMIELGWGANHVLVTTARFAGGTKFDTAAAHLRFWAPRIPAGQTIYYRMKTETAVADTAQVHLRVHQLTR